MGLLQRIRGEAASRLAYPVAERLTGRNIRAKRLDLERNWALSAAERRQRAAGELAEMVAWAGAAVPYYRDLFAKLAFDPAKLKRDPDRLGELPYLTKDILRAEGFRLLSDRHGDRPKHCSRTGGSTGPAADIYFDQEAADWASAVTRHARAAIGKPHAFSELHLASRFPERFPLRDRLKESVKCFAMNRYNVFIGDFEPASLDRLWRRIRQIRPYLLHGHPSTISHLARHLDGQGRLERAFEVFESSGELLDPRQRERIKRVFGCHVIDRYGLAEFGVVAYQMREEYGSLRLYDSIVWPETSTAGELVLTGLKNRLMPLIRYRTGDLATLSQNDEGLALSRLVGRVHDLVSIGGKIYPSHYVQDLLQRIGGIAEFQIEIGAGTPVLRLVLEHGRRAEEIQARIADWWGDALEVEFVQPAALKRAGQRAKFRHVIEVGQA